MTVRPNASGSVVLGSLLLGRYRVVEELGAGGYGVVLGVEDVTLHRRVAMKILHRTRADSPNDVSRFFREAEACSRLKSPYTTHIFTADEAPEIGPYLLMEWLHGADLGAVLRRDGPLSVARAVHHVLEAATALAEAHAAGIVHRDLKPSNLFLANDSGRTLVKVLDFGMAKMVDDAAQLTASGAMIGTPRYMAPEQLHAPQTVDQRADVWALAAVLFELLSGASPFAIDPARGVAGYLFRPPPTPLRAVCPHAPPHLEALLMRCLAQDPTLRPAHMGEVASALASLAPADAPLVDSIQRYVASMPMRLPPPQALPPMTPVFVAAVPSAVTGAPAPLPAAKPTRSGFGAVAGIVGAMMLLLAAGGGALWWVGRKGDAPNAASDAGSATPDASTQGASRTPASDASTLPAATAPAPHGTPSSVPTLPVAPPKKDAAAPTARRRANDTGIACTPSSTCPPDATCIGGSCSCALHLLACNGRCVPPTAAHCESCSPCKAGDACLEVGGYGEGSVCTSTCVARGGAVCGSNLCRSLNTENNCGRCFRSCGFGMLCRDGECTAR